MRTEDGEPVRALVVEDDDSTAATLAAFLDSLEGVETAAVAKNGREGLELIRRERPNLVLLDIVMPEMDGLSLLHELRKEEAKARPYIIVVSGVSSDVTVQRALGLGAEFYMVKPVRLPALRERVYDRFRRPKGRPREGEALARWYLEEMGGEKEPAAALVSTAAAALARYGVDMLKVGYAEIRRVHGVDYVAAERAVRRCIASLHRKDRAEYRALLGGEPGERPPSNGVFLRALTEKLRREMEET